MQNSRLRVVLNSLCKPARQGVDSFAHASGVSRSDYVRQAVEEKNARALAERMIFLSQTLSASTNRSTRIWKIRQEMGLPVVKRGEIWEVDFEPQEEPGKRRRPALVLQTNTLNTARHSTTIIVPGTTGIYRDASGDGFPLRVPIGKPGSVQEETDLLVDQIRAISNQRFLGDKPLTTLAPNHWKRVMQALALLTKQTTVAFFHRDVSHNWYYVKYKKSVTKANNRAIHVSPVLQRPARGYHLLAPRES